MHAKLTSAEVVAQFRYEALTQTTTETFNRSESWCIYDPSHQPLWLAEGADFPYTAP